MLWFADINPSLGELRSDVAANAIEEEHLMQTSRLKSALLAGSLSTIAAAVAATAAAPTPVAAAETMHVAGAMSNPCGAGNPCAPKQHRSMHKVSKMTTSGQAASNPCGPGRGSPNAASYGSSNPCGPASNSGR
jgi:hypothetical protein